MSKRIQHSHSQGQILCRAVWRLPFVSFQVFQELISEAKTALMAWVVFRPSASASRAPRSLKFRPPAAVCLVRMGAEATAKCREKLAWPRQKPSHLHCDIPPAPASKGSTSWKRQLTMAIPCARSESTIAPSSAGPHSVDQVPRGVATRCFITLVGLILILVDLRHLQVRSRVDQLPELFRRQQLSRNSRTSW